MAKLIIEQDPAKIMRSIVHGNQSKVEKHLLANGYQLVHKGYLPKTNHAPIDSDYRNHGQTFITYHKPGAPGNHEVQISYLGKVGARKFSYGQLPDPKLGGMLTNRLRTDNPDHFISHLNKMHGK